MNDYEFFLSIKKRVHKLIFGNLCTRDTKLIFIIHLIHVYLNNFAYTYSAISFEAVKINVVSFPLTVPNISSIFS